MHLFDLLLFHLLSRDVNCGAFIGVIKESKVRISLKIDTLLFFRTGSYVLVLFIANIFLCGEWFTFGFSYSDAELYLLNEYFYDM